MGEHIFYLVALWAGYVGVTATVFIGSFWVVGRAIDAGLDLFAIRAAVCFYIVHRQAIRKAIGEDPHLKTQAERWHEKWKNQRIF